MSAYDYGNARLRALKSHLLTRRGLENLAETGSLPGMITALTKTVYRKVIEIALARSTGTECIDEALRMELVSTLGKIPRFYQGAAGEMVSIILRSYDLHNIIAILRGLWNNIAPEEILDTLLPVCELDMHIMRVLMGAQSTRAVIDTMASMNLPYAVPLLKLRAKKPAMDISQIEFALQYWYFQRAQEYLADNAQDGYLRDAVNLEADIINIRAAIRIVHASTEHDKTSIHLGQSLADGTFVGPGTLSFELLYRIRESDEIRKCVEIFEGTPYFPVMLAGLDAYSLSGKLSDFEQNLNRFRLNWMASLIIRDPLGIGLVLGYIALKNNEVNNIRWIANGINLGLSLEDIRQHLEIVE